ncbi:FAD-dependent oxidoreductase [Chloroflexi bacterium TSY]|nr:FAD-dependent oxidoreductase [Chloroflexi bacterium TSY]
MNLLFGLALSHLPKIAAQDGRLLICGGGLTGIEAATELAETYPKLRVTLVTKGAFGEQLSLRGQQHLRHAFDRLNIDVIEQKTIRSLQPNHAVCADDSTIPFDICLWAGAFSVPTLACHVGLLVNKGGQIIVDEHLRAKLWPNIYAVGDAATLEEVLPIPIRMACATAAPMGAYVGTYLAAIIEGRKQQAPYRFRYLLRCISLGRHDGLVQLVEADDTVKNRVVTGWLGAKIKELVCRGTIWNMQFERQLAALLAGSRQNHPREVEKPSQQTT